MKERRFWWHWQNLRKDYPKKWLYGRAWLHMYDRGEVNVEWSVPTSLCHLKMAVGWGELLFSIACGLFGLWLKFEGIPWLRKGKYEKREIGISYFMHSLNWRVWADPDSHSSKTPRWRDGWFSIPDFLFGRAKYTKVDQPPVPATLTMPEGEYAVTVILFSQTWKRPRWPVARWRDGGEVDIEGGIPVPGKGESEWDCGEDAYLSIGTSATTVEEAVADVTARVLERRERYGGKNWLPDAVR